MKSNNLVIAFSGGCFSGKSTTMEYYKKFFGDRCVMLTENVRDKTIFSIDEIRQNPSHYLKFQNEVILDKINKERELIENNTDKIILIDRALTDSLFYLIFYVDKNGLSTDDLILYNSLLKEVKKACRYAFEKLYDYVIEFYPLNTVCDDKVFRPDEISHLKYMEHSVINIINKAYCKPIKIDLNKDGIDAITYFLLYRDIKMPDTYEEYRKSIDKVYAFDNIVSNRRRSIKIDCYNEVWFYNHFFTTSCLFTEDKNKSDKIFEHIEMLDTDEEFLETRSHPIGYFKEGNLMIVGEAPGKFGRSVTEGGLKPSFVFTKTSFILKRALFDNKRYLKYFPYITNLCKYANEKNKPIQQDFHKCFPILMEEIKLMKPSKIIALGNITYKYLLENLPYEYKSILVKYAHPTSILFNGGSQRDYSQNLKNVLI